MNNETSIKLPAKYEKFLDEVSKDLDGYWAYTKKGYYFGSMETHTAHEDTQAELLKVIRTIETCECDSCRL